MLTRYTNRLVSLLKRVHRCYLRDKGKKGSARGLVARGKSSFGLEEDLSRAEISYNQMSYVQEKVKYKWVERDWAVQIIT